MVGGDGRIFKFSIGGGYMGYVAGIDGEQGLREQFGSPGVPRYDDIEAAVNDFAERYDIRSEEENLEYWEDILGAALLEQDRMENVEENWTTGKYGWAWDTTVSDKETTAVAGGIIGAAAIPALALPISTVLVGHSVLKGYQAYENLDQFSESADYTETVIAELEDSLAADEF